MNVRPLNAMGNGDGRRSDGTFAPGHKFARGNPNNRKAQKLRNAVIGAVSKKDMVAIVVKAVEQAKTGDAAARAWLADRLLGKVSETELRERVERLEDLLTHNGANGKAVARC